MTKTTTSSSATVTLLLLAAPAWAEVMDKEPSRPGLWLTAAVVGVAGLVAWLWKGWAGAVVSVVGLAWVWSFHWELVDPWVGPAIRQEAGPQYVRQAYASMMVCTLAHVVGITVWFVLRRGKASQGKPSRGSHGESGAVEQ